MAEPSLEAEYQRILADSRRTGDLLEEPAGQERRRHPRIRVKPGDLPTELDPWVFAIDISISGMAFYADEAVEPGRKVTIHLGDLATADVEVLACRQEQSTARHLPARYRLHCRFADEEQGKRLLVTIKDLEGAARPT
ncbi:MAG TPA: PilZ domain-containing protein [bacterium]|nr:PilZ domain-containing protein [bacterium]